MQQLKYYLIVVAIGMIACRPVAFMVMGVKKPKVENEQSLGRFIQHSKMQQGRHVISTWSGYIDNLRDLGLTTVHIFSREGRSLKLGEQTKSACGPDPLPFIANMRSNTHYEPATDSLLLDSVTNRLLLLNGARFDYSRPDSVDFTAIVTWTRWIGYKIVDRDVASTLQAIADNKNVVFDVIIVNLDQQAVWGPENLGKIKTTRTSIDINN